VPSDVLVALDEAYYEYLRPTETQQYDALALHRRYPNLVVLRTFSKAYGLAGLRVGYAVADPVVTNALLKVHLPFSVNSVAQAAAIASLHAKDELLVRTDAVVAERERVSTELRAAGYSVPPSQANFVWLDLADDTIEFAQEAMDAGVIIRPFAGEGVRVTVTHAEENDRFLAFARDRASR
jgi:histidinol-phosphate aminotransferase